MIAINYGGRDELPEQHKNWLMMLQLGDFHLKTSTKKRFQSTDTHVLLDPDLLIRTSGETRIHGFVMADRLF